MVNTGWSNFPSRRPGVRPSAAPIVPLELRSKSKTPQPPTVNRAEEVGVEEGANDAAVLLPLMLIRSGPKGCRFFFRFALNIALRCCGNATGPEAVVRLLDNEDIREKKKKKSL